MQLFNMYAIECFYDFPVIKKNLFYQSGSLFMVIITGTPSVIKWYESSKLSLVLLSKSKQFFLLNCCTNTDLTPDLDARKIIGQTL